MWLKNRVFKAYGVETDNRPEHPFIPNSDKEALRNNILHLLANSPSRAIATQLGATLKTVIAHDFPEKWPGLIPQVKQLLQSNSIQEVHAGCVASLEAVKAFKYVHPLTLLEGSVAETYPP